MLTMEALKKSAETMPGRMLEQLGAEGVRLVREKMLTGYARPVHDTGALAADVQYRVTGERSMEIGSTLPYATAVHNGTRYVLARPYLTDGLLGGLEALRAAAIRAAQDCL